MASLINSAFSALGRILGLSPRSSRTSATVNGGQLLDAHFWSRPMVTMVDGIPHTAGVPLATLQDVQKELASGASATDKDVFDGWTPLHYAVRYNTDTEIIALLLEQGADVNSKTNLGRTPLQLAAGYNSDARISGLLLDRGADIAAKNDAGLTALHFAARSNNNPRVIELLLDRGSDLEARTNSNSTPLHFAAQSNVHPGIILKLLELGADLTAQDGDGNMPLHRALANNNLTAHDLLFDAMWEAAEPTPFESYFMNPMFFGAAEPGYAGIYQNKEFLGITFNIADMVRIRREMNATHESLTLFPLICLPVEDADGKYLFIVKNVDPMHHRYQFYEFEPGPGGGTVLKLGALDVAKLEEHSFRFCGPAVGWRERLSQIQMN